MIKLVVIWSFLFCFLNTINAQDTITKEKKLLVNGYIKELQSLGFQKGFTDLVTGNLIHNRINFKWKPNASLTAAAEFRNRFYWGEEVRRNPSFVLLLKHQQQMTDLSKIWVKNNDLVLHSNTERLYVDYHKTKWNVRVGRQRINWGLSTFWNPNDLFNTYNFLDFDYEERPGADAIKGQYFLKDNVNLEGALAASGIDKKSIGAIKYAVNKWGYDMQAIAGWYKQNKTVGAGWAGSIKDAGFKGEVMYFTKNNDSLRQLNLAMESDYIFKDGWYFNAGFLFNSTGISQPVTDYSKLQFNLTPKNLLPVKWTTSVTASKGFTPLLTVSFSTLYAPGVNLLILLPSLKYSVSSTFDFDLFWQSYFLETSDGFGDVSHNGYLRFKWSF